MVQEVFRMGRFQDPGAESIAITHQGTRPGAPFGDAVLIFVIAEVTAKVSTQLAHEGLRLQFPKNKD
eukprot:2876244-Pyramimonas_sp.AAC.1